MKTEEKEQNCTFVLTKNAMSVLERSKMLPFCRKMSVSDSWGSYSVAIKKAHLQGSGVMGSADYHKTKDMREIDEQIEKSVWFPFCRNLILVAPDDGRTPQNTGQTLRAACYAAKRWDELRPVDESEYEDHFEEFDYCFDDYCDEEEQDRCVRMDTFLHPESSEDYFPIVQLKCLQDPAYGNPYVPCLSVNTDEKIRIVTGLTDEVDLELKLDAIRADQYGFKVIVISDKIRSDPLIRAFMTEWGYQSLTISKADEEDDIEMLGFLLAEGRYRDTLKSVFRNALKGLRKIYGHGFDTEHLVMHCYKAVTAADSAELPALTADLFYDESEKKGAIAELNAMTGLRNVKRTVEAFAALVMEEQRNPKLNETHRNMIFYGNPGSGKTTVARQVAKILAECGVGNGVFVEADRSSLIGRYVGHTAPMVKKKFDEARGGVLFVDEAGLFLQEGSGGYVDEAMKEFIRYMENYPDVTVIFAIYERELEGFLKLDEGLSSRISRLVAFEDYTEKQLQEIVLKMLKDRGYCLTRRSGAEMLLDYITENRKEIDNGRGARLLAETIVEEHSLDLYRHPEYVESRHLKISNEDIRHAIERMNERSEKNRNCHRQTGFKLSASAPAKPRVKCAM